MEAQLFNNDRIKEAAQVIANELLKILAKRHDSHMQKHVAKNCPAYKKGLSNGEHLLATMRALSMVQLEVGVELADMTHTVDEDLHDDDDAPDPVRRPVGIGGRLTPNCDRPCDNAPRSSLGKSVTSDACTNSRCCGSALVVLDASESAAMATGLTTARAATALMAVESLRRRRFGTEVSIRITGLDIGYM